MLTRADVPGEVGPGHNSFTVDELGNPLIVYHSRTVNDTSLPGEATDAGLFDPRSHARAAPVHWNVAGMPVFAMTADEQLAPANAAETRCAWSWATTSTPSSRRWSPAPNPDPRTARRAGTARLRR